MPKDPDLGMDTEPVWKEGDHKKIIKTEKEKEELLHRDSPTRTSLT